MYDYIDPTILVLQLMDARVDLLSWQLALTSHPPCWLWSLVWFPSFGFVVWWVVACVCVSVFVNIYGCARWWTRFVLCFWCDVHLCNFIHGLKRFYRLHRPYRFLTTLIYRFKRHTVVVLIALRCFILIIVVVKTHRETVQQANVKLWDQSAYKGKI